MCGQADEEVEARAMAYTTSFKVDVNKILQPPKNVLALEFYYLLMENMSSAIMHHYILYDHFVLSIYAFFILMSERDRSFILLKYLCLN